MTETVETPETDLFGEPLKTIRSRQGRPSFGKTTENQRLVALLVAAGWTQSRVAAYLGCDEKTLRKHFSRELNAGSDMVEAEALQVCYRQMRQGKSTAISKIFDIIDKGNVAPPQKKVTPENSQKLGKKEQLNAEASRPTGGWSEMLQ